MRCDGRARVSMAPTCLREVPCAMLSQTLLKCHIATELPTRGLTARLIEHRPGKENGAGVKSQNASGDLWLLRSALAKKTNIVVLPRKNSPIAQTKEMAGAPRVDTAPRLSVDVSDCRPREKSTFSFGTGTRLLRLGGGWPGGREVGQFAIVTLPWHMVLCWSVEQFQVCGLGVRLLAKKGGTERHEEVKGLYRSRLRD